MKSNNLKLHLRLLLFLFFIVSHSWAQTYQLKPLQTGVTLGIGVFTSALGYSLEKRAKPITFSELNNLSIHSINAFDQGTAFNYSSTANQLSDFTAGFAIVAPLSLLGSKKVRGEWLPIGVLAAEMFFITYGVTSVTKGSVLRLRPISYNSLVPLEERINSDNRLSFFSRHASLATAATFFGAKVFSDLNTDSKLKPWVWVGAAILPTITCVQRVQSGQHFPTDVIMGYAFGGFMGWLVPTLHKLDSTAKVNLVPTINGFYLNCQF